MNWHFQNSLLHFKFCLNLTFFIWNNCFLVFSYQLCLLGLYVTSNVVKFIAYFSLMSHTMMVFRVRLGACVNDTVHILYMLFKSFLWWAIVHHVTFSSPPEFGGYQCISKVQNTFQYFNWLVWYFITLYHLIKLWYLTVNLSWYHIFYGRTLATTAAIFLP